MNTVAKLKYMNTVATSLSQNNEGLKCQDMLVEVRWVEWG